MDTVTHCCKRENIFCIRVHLNCFPTDPRQISSDHAHEERLSSTPSCKAHRSRHGRNHIRSGRLASKLCEKLAMLKGSKNRTIQMDDSDYKRLKSEMIESNNLEVW